MTQSQLQSELNEVQAATAHWRTRASEAEQIIRRAQEQLAQAQQQILLLQGHAERIGLWLERLAGAGAQAGADGEAGAGY